MNLDLEMSADEFMDAMPVMLLESPIESVSDAAWTDFVRVMLTAPIGAVSASNCLGAFAMAPRRLQELGVLEKLSRTKSRRSKRTIWATSSVRDQDRATEFLKSLSLQFKFFTRSMCLYYAAMKTGEIRKPENMSYSEALAILHRAGTSGLSGERFPATQRAADRARGIF